MGDFSQNGFVTTLHNFGTKSVEQFEAELKIFSGYRPMELILPSLYSELEGPALKHIVEEISQVDYVGHVVIGLDKADKGQFKHASEFFKGLRKPFSLLWNDGPRLRAIQEELEAVGLGPTEAGKGRNVWYSIGFVNARGKADAVGLHDCDVLTYDNCQLLPNSYYAGDAVPCLDYICNDPSNILGACCASSGGCIPNRTRAFCESLPAATYLGEGSNCSDCIAENAIGRCCVGRYYCMDGMNYLDCLAVEGTFTQGTSCAVDCFIGTCCVDGNCFDDID